MRNGWSRSCSRQAICCRTKPRLGRVVPELGQQNIRERFVYSYRVIYEIQPEALHILAVIHGKRLLESVEDRFPDDTP
jgi:toxin ParE1/3/4